jgi:hypothetical protein
LQELRASGLSDKTIYESGVCTETDRSKLTRILKRKYLPFDSEALVYRYFTGDTPNCYVRVKPLNPRDDERGKTVKYESPDKIPPRAYIPPRTYRLIREGTDSIYITEGEKKTLALAQLGLPAIGLGGVWSFKTKDDDGLIPDLAEIDWEFTTVYVVYDYDPKETTRRHVDVARRRLATLLKEAGAEEVYNVALPPATDGDKQGVDDFLVAHGAEAFHALVGEAQPAIRIIPIIPPAPQALGEKAYHGPAGRFVRAVSPYTEATEHGILAHLLPAVATIIGPKVHLYAGAKHPCRINTMLVGLTNGGRKGTSFGPVDELMKKVGEKFWNTQRVNGLSSGEGLIDYVADKYTYNPDTKQNEPVDPPVERRLYVVEDEFSRVLANTSREGNVLSQVIRSCFDHGNLGTLTVNPRRASGAHICITGHITPEELKKRLTDVDKGNGFGNRFLWFHVKSDKVLPSADPIPDAVYEEFLPRLRALHSSIGGGQKEHTAGFDDDAKQLWEEVYTNRLRADQPGLAGAMVARGSTMVLRLALIYAALDWPKPLKLPGDKYILKPSGKLIVKTEHLEAALAVWDYCEASAKCLFFDNNDGKDLCNKLLDLLATGPKTKDEINDHLSAKQKKDFRSAMATLEAEGKVEKGKRKSSGAGRPAVEYSLS